MDGGKKQPELFRSNLFSPSGGLSLGLSDESFNSPLSLAPALATAASGTPSSKCALIGTSSPYTCTRGDGDTLRMVVGSKLQFHR